MRPIDADLATEMLKLSTIFDLTDVPTVDPVQHAHWIEERYGPSSKCAQYRCSKCGNCDSKHTAIRGHYCWFCGSKMDGDENDID